MKASTSALLVGLVAVPAYFAFANTADIAKEWRGTVGKAGDIPVTLKIIKAKTGDDAGTVKWGEPYKCTSHLEYITEKDKEWSFTLRKGYGPFCDSVNGGKLYLKLISKAELQYRMEPPKTTPPKTQIPSQETVLTSP